MYEKVQNEIWTRDPLFPSLTPYPLDHCAITKSVYFTNYIATAMKNAVRVSLASRIGASVEKKVKKPDRFFVYGVANLPFFFGQDQLLNGSQSSP